MQDLLLRWALSKRVLTAKFRVALFPTSSTFVGLGFSQPLVGTSSQNTSHRHGRGWVEVKLRVLSLVTTNEFTV